MLPHHRPRCRREPVRSKALPDAPGETDVLRLKLAVQRNRALAYSIAGGVTLLDKLTGTGSFDDVMSLIVLGLGYVTVLLFVRMERRQKARDQRRDLEVWWIACDVVLITAMVWLTGGGASPWYLWYLACAGAAAAHCSVRVSLVGAGLTTAMYFGTLIGMGQIRGLDAGLFHAASNLLFLLGASLFLLYNTRRLRGSVLMNRQLKRQAVERVEELTRVTRDLEAMSRLLQDVTEKDPLTDVHNRRYFMRRIADDAVRFASDQRISERQRTTGIIMLDLDRFKAINDLHGHTAGDQLLKHLAFVLRGCVRGDDRIVRWGGDEFVILLPHTSEQATGEVAERVVAAVRLHPVELPEGGICTLSCSVGWSIVDWHQVSQAAAPWEAAMAAADEALYRCKAAGGDCSRFVDHSHLADAPSRRVKPVLDAPPRAALAAPVLDASPVAKLAARASAPPPGEVPAVGPAVNPAPAAPAVAAAGVAAHAVERSAA